MHAGLVCWVVLVYGAAVEAATICSSTLFYSTTTIDPRTPGVVQVGPQTADQVSLTSCAPSMTCSHIASTSSVNSISATSNILIPAVTHLSVYTLVPAVTVVGLDHSTTTLTPPVLFSSTITDIPASTVTITRTGTVYEADSICTGNPHRLRRRTSPVRRTPCPSEGQVVCDGGCVDTDVELEHCGACNNACDHKSHARNVGCENGQCIVLSCRTGWRPSIRRDSCVRDITGITRRAGKSLSKAPMSPSAWRHLFGLF